MKTNNTGNILTLISITLWAFLLGGLLEYLRIEFSIIPLIMIFLISIVIVLKIYLIHLKYKELHDTIKDLEKKIEKSIPSDSIFSPTEIIKLMDFYKQ